MCFAGGRTASDIITWLKKKTGPPAVSVEDAAAVTKMTEGNDVVVVGFFKVSTQNLFKTFIITSEVLYYASL